MNPNKTITILVDWYFKPKEMIPVYYMYPVFQKNEI